MAIFYELQDSEAGKSLAAFGFVPDPGNGDHYVKVFGDSILSIHVNRPGPMKGPRKLSDPILLDIFGRSSYVPSMRLQFPSVTAFLKSVYDHR